MSSIKTRLYALHGKVNMEIRPTADAAGLRQRIQRIAQRARLMSMPMVRHDGLDQFLGGEWLGDHCLLIEKRVPLTRRHGDVSLQGVNEIDLSLFSKSLATTPVEQLVFLDTETNGLSGGSGTVVFLLGIARIIDSEFVLRQYLLTGYAGEAALYQHACAWLADDSVLVSFNGKSFDMPLMESRQRLLRLDPMEFSRHIDLLHHTRRAYALRWRDCSLKSAERKLLAFNRLDDLPGSEAPRVWQEFIRFGDSSRLRALLQHHYWDVLSLLALLVRLQAVFQDPTQFGANTRAIARHYVKDQQEDLALEKLSESRDTLDHEGFLDLARLFKQKQQWPEAIAIWQHLAEQKSCDVSLENLAKYYEHIEKNYARAMQYAQRIQHTRQPAVAAHQRVHRLARKNITSWSDVKSLLLETA